MKNTALQRCFFLPAAIGFLVPQVKTEIFSVSSIDGGFMSAAHVFLFLILGYFLGSIPFGLLIAKKVKGIDIREHGSRSTGATNVFRVVGKKWGFLVLFLDALKGALAVILPQLFFAEIPFLSKALFAVSAILGHTFSFWIQWKGGKGVATSLGVFLALAPLPAAATLAGWILVFSFTRVISIASLAAALLFPAAIAVFFNGREEFPYLFPLGFLLAVFIFYTHRANITRILKGEEKKII